MRNAPFLSLPSLLSLLSLCRTTALKRQFAKSAKLEKTIWANMKGVGFGQ